MNLKLVADYKPTGDQPEAIAKINQLLEEDVNYITLNGVTGSGKTFTMANVIAQQNRPTLILSHNKTLAAQLYNEFKGFFPDNAVHYFVSYYDYYQPEAYLPTTDTYIEKDLAINDEIDKMRIAASSALLSGRRDIIIVATVSCIYGIGNPDDFQALTIELKVGQSVAISKVMHDLNTALYVRSEVEFESGLFIVRGDTLEVYISGSDTAFRVRFYGNKIEQITIIDPVSRSPLEERDRVVVRPAKLFVATKERVNNSIREIQDDLFVRHNELMDMGKSAEANRLKSRVEYDLEMIKEVGYCSGIENYSRYFDGRKAGSRPFCLIDYFPEDFLTIVDESHVSLPQIRGMYGGDRARKENLVEFGFRLPSAFDNRPLIFDEFEQLTKQTIYVSATPADYEIIKSEGLIVEQFIRPTGLLDPQIEIIPTENQIDTIFERIDPVIKRDERVLITTLTKRMAEELSKYMERASIRCQYIHSDIDNVERVKILEEYRIGMFDVLIGVNLLREGLDMPEVSLVIIMDADKEGFLRTERSMTQTAGRAARNVNGHVIMFADRISNAMRQTIDATNRRRQKQMTYNERNNIVPTQIVKRVSQVFERSQEPQSEPVDYRELQRSKQRMVAQSKAVWGDDLQQEIDKEREAMNQAAKSLDFAKATIHRDRLIELEKRLKK